MSVERTEEGLLSAASEFPQGDDAVWEGRRIIWKKPETWVPVLTAWLAPDFRADAMRRLKPGVYRDICWDDSEWLQVLKHCTKGTVESIADNLDNAILYSVIRTYHGCRTDDAGTYFRDGLLVHRQERLKERILSIIEAHDRLQYMRPKLDTMRAARDEGRAYVAVSDETLLRDSAHYLIHGSEWVMSQFDDVGRSILRQIGAPTLIEIDLPFSSTHSDDRRAFAEDMLKEWTRVACNGQGWMAPIDCSFWLIQDVPPNFIVGHSHPASMKNPHDGMRVYRSPITTCKYCAKG